MSQENVELVLGVFPAPDVDVVPLYRDETSWAEQAEALAPFIHADFECVRYEFGARRATPAWMV